MGRSLANLFDDLPDLPHRDGQVFSAEMASANQRILTGAEETDVLEALAGWLAKYQPCLFGRVAAKRELLSYCILDEDIVRAGDLAVRNKIQEARRRWTAEAFHGRKSGFVILLRSRRITFAPPSETLLALAQRLASLYLLEEVEPNRIYLDEVFLEAPGSPPAAWRWPAGVNYFGAQGDGRWWHDHRIPGGFAFSVNSVGHMVKSGQLASAMADLAETLEIEGQVAPVGTIDSLPKALEFAMRTIALAAETPWGRATELLPLPSDAPPCPVALPAFLADKNHCQYRGWYHTDQTLPREYFAASDQRPPAQQQQVLDFTYLFHDSLNNPDFRRVGQGLRIRGDAVAKRSRGSEVTVEIRRSARLREALAEYAAGSTG